MLESRATAAADVVYLENKTRIFFVDGEAELHRYDRDFELLADMALPPAESLDFIRDVARDVADPASAASQPARFRLASARGSARAD